MEDRTMVDMKLAEVKLPQPNISRIKNKQRRSEAFRKLKKEKIKVIKSQLLIDVRPGAKRILFHCVTELQFHGDGEGVV